MSGRSLNAVGETSVNMIKIQGTVGEKSPRGKLFIADVTFCAMPV